MSQPELADPTEYAHILAGGEITSLEGETPDQVSLRSYGDLWVGRRIAVLRFGGSWTTGAGALG